MEEKEINLTKSKKILFAEDDSSMRRFIEVILKKFGYEVILAEDGLMAMNIALTDSEIDIFVFDAMMPNFTGYDLCRILRQNPQHTEKPIIILSGLEITEKTNEGAADCYLIKNVALQEELKNALLRLLNDK